MPSECSPVRGLVSDSVGIRVPQDMISERRNVLLELERTRNRQKCEDNSGGGSTLQRDNVFSELVRLCLPGSGEAWSEERSLAEDG